MKKILQTITLGLIITTLASPFTCSAMLSNTSTDLSTKLHKAVGEGDLTLIKQLIKQGANVNAINERGRTPLLNAIIGLQVNVVQLLLANKNTDIDLEGTWNVQPLRAAFLKMRCIEHMCNYVPHINLRDIEPIPLAKEIANFDQELEKIKRIMGLLFTHGAQLDQTVNYFSDIIPKKTIGQEQIMAMFSDCIALEKDFEKNPEKAIREIFKTKITIFLERIFKVALKNGDHRTLQLVNKMSQKNAWEYALTFLASCPNATLLPTILYKTGHKETENYAFLWDEGTNLSTDQNLDSKSPLLTTYIKAKTTNNTSLGKALIATGVHLKNLQGPRSTGTTMPNEVAYKIMSYLPAITSSTYVCDTKKKNLKRKNNAQQPVQNKKKK